MGSLNTEHLRFIMSKHSKTETIVGQYFRWILFSRNGVLYADGRSNSPSAGKHSLGTRDRAEALQTLHRLDAHRALALGLADRSILESNSVRTLALEQGWELYREHASRPRVSGGAKPATVKRYKPVLKKFIAFATAERVVSWTQVTALTLQKYNAWLDKEGYAPKTQHFEINTLKQVHNWLQSAGHIPESRINLPLRKIIGTNTYCWRPVEVAAIVAYCYAHAHLVWLGNVVIALATTGLRISELVGLRITDVDRVRNIILLTDESSRGDTLDLGRRETKNGRSRSFPIGDELRALLDRLPPSACGLLLHGPDGERLHPDTVRTTLIRDVLTPLADCFPASPGVRGFRDGRLHSFRHYFCSQCATSGIPVPALMQWLGHQSSAMVRHYYHLHDHQAQEQMARVTFVPNVGGTLPPTNSRGGAECQTGGS
jgi:integrase